MNKVSIEMFNIMMTCFFLEYGYVVLYILNNYDIDISINNFQFYREIKVPRCFTYEQKNELYILLNKKYGYVKNIKDEEILLSHKSFNFDSKHIENEEIIMAKLIQDKCLNLPLLNLRNYI